MKELKLIPIASPEKLERLRKQLAFIKALTEYVEE